MLFIFHEPSREGLKLQLPGGSGDAQELRQPPQDTSGDHDRRTHTASGGRRLFFSFHEYTYLFRRELQAEPEQQVKGLGRRVGLCIKALSGKISPSNSTFFSFMTVQHGQGEEGNVFPARALNQIPFRRTKRLLRWSPGTPRGQE